MHSWYHNILRPCVHAAPTITVSHLNLRHHLLRPVQEPLHFVHINLGGRTVLMPHYLLDRRRIHVPTFVSMIRLCRCPSDSSITDQLIVHGPSLAASQSPVRGLVIPDSAPNPPPVVGRLLDQIGRAFS